MILGRHASGTLPCYARTMSKSANWLTGATPAEYHSYLVRIWRPGPRSQWRITVEAIATGERRGFANLEELLRFLQTQLNPPPAKPGKADQAHSE